jgi:aspartyl-tRNA(Asn)/glutamyl-tRNA(Gln) amidotransferase subunit A
MDDPLQMYLSDIFTISPNLAGIPGLSIPCGYTQGGLPIGVQFQAGHFQEGKLLQVAPAYASHSGIERRRPKL